MEVEQDNKQHCHLLMTDDWKTRGTIVECNRYMLQSKVASDVQFCLGSSGQEVVAHKYMLISRSPVFYAMFCGSMADTSGVITVPDIEPGIFELFLR